MAIDVICPGCHSRFQVSEKFAGKKGPCPKCKVTITIPAKAEEVVIHAPAPTGPVDSKGQAVLQPIFRQEAKISNLQIGIIAASVFVVLLCALVLRIGAEPPGNISNIVLIVGAIALAPPLVFAGYTFLRDDELEPHRGTALYIRLIPCSVVYPLLWGVYWLVFAYLGITPQLITMVFVVPAVIAAGALCAQASLDLEFGTGALHYSLYLVATVLLRLLLGMNGIWNVVSETVTK